MSILSQKEVTVKNQKKINYNFLENLQAPVEIEELTIKKHLTFIVGWTSCPPLFMDMRDAIGVNLS